MARQMPKQGYYLLNQPLSSQIGLIECIYTTGQRGGGGHCYKRVWVNQPNTPNCTCGKFKNGWTTLLWSCVPSQNDLNTNYTYYTTCPPLWLDWK